MIKIIDMPPNEPPKIPMPIDPDILDFYKECKCGCENAIYPPCKKCGKYHGMGVKNSQTGHIEPIDLCKECLFEPWDKHYEKFVPQI